MRLVPAAAALVLAMPAAAQQRPAVTDTAAAVDAIFSSYASPESPGCAVGVSRGGRPVLTRAYGMTDLEHDVPNTPRSVFEAGSVSKQVTAGAALLLAEEGKISLDDDVRKYFPELPDYGAPVTVRHLIHHTSGLRDWGAVAGLEGWPRGSRVHTHTHMLDIAARQRSLNYAPGTYYSYTNTGYNLLAMLVERVSGKSFAEFTRERFFAPLGMTRTQWRDDYTRLVEDRAIAYEPAQGGGFRMDMPFENVHGNGGLLTTVDDLLTWTENLRTGRAGGPGWVAAMHRPGRLNSGRQIDYAGGLVVSRFRGVPEVSHSGATAGYRAYAARYPEQGVAVAVLCNAGNANPTRFARQVAEIYLGKALAAAEPSPRAGVAVAPEALSALAGTYRETRTHTPVRLAVVDGALRPVGGPALVPLSPTRFHAPGGGGELIFDAAPAAGARRPGFFRVDEGDSVRYEPVEEWKPTAAELGALAGRYRSEEAEAAYTVALDGERLVLRPRFGNPQPLNPAYPDAFRAPTGMIRFHRDAAGRVTAMSVSSGRVWDLRFQRER